MVRWFLCLMATLGMCLSIVFPASTAAAGDKGKRWQSAMSNSSNGSSNGSSSGFSSPMLRNKISTTPRKLTLSTGNSSSSSNWKKFQASNGLGNSSSSVNKYNGNSLPLGKQFSGRTKLKDPISLGSFGTGVSTGGTSPSDNLQNGISKNGSKVGNLGSTRKSLAEFHRAKIADAFKNGKFQPIGGLGGLAGGGLGGNGNGPGNPADPGNGQADPNPGGDPGNGGGNGNPGNGNGGGGNGGGNGGPNGPHDDDCHKHPFPWWPPIIIGGGGGHHHHHHCPPTTNITVIEQPITVVPEVQNVPATVDLQLMDVRLVDAGNPAQNLGPRYRIVFGNAGTLPAGNFRVMAMASLDGTPKPELPMAAAEVVALAAGEVAMADVRLPLTADLSTMGALIVVIDSAVQIVETNEQNNVAVLDRLKIAAVELAAVTAP